VKAGSARDREGMRAAKVLMEQQLQETAGELMAAERELAARAGGEPAALHPAGGAACIGLPGAGALPQRGSAGGGDEVALVGALRAENDAIMQVPRPGAPVSPRPESASTQVGEACMPPQLLPHEGAQGVCFGAPFCGPPRARRLALLARLPHGLQRSVVLHRPCVPAPAAAHAAQKVCKSLVGSAGASLLQGRARGRSDAAPARAHRSWWPRRWSWRSCLRRS